MTYVVTPVLQLNLPEKLDRLLRFKEGVRFTGITGEMRRRLLDSAKSAKCPDRTLHEINDAGALIWLELPQSSPFDCENWKSNALTYLPIAGAIARRLVDCLKLISHVPFPGERRFYLWFGAASDTEGGGILDVFPLNAE
jgi:hypothetical protein